MRCSPSLKAISDDELLRRVSELLGQSRRVEADLVAHIAEVDARRLFAREAAPSMFAWCTEVLHLSEHEAYLRITAARASREHPVLLTMLRDGRLHLSGIALLARHLTPETRDEILKRAARMPHRQLKQLAAELEPKPDARASIRKLPARRDEVRPEDARQLGTYRVESPANSGPHSNQAAATGAERVSTEAVPAPNLRPVVAASSPGRRATVEPLPPARYKVQFTAGAELREKLERLQALMRSRVPDGDLAKLIDVAVTEKLERLEAKRFAKTKAPRKNLADTDTTPSRRYIPAAVRRIVHARDGGRCTYHDRLGRRCTERHALEFHHRKPFGRGGDHSPEALTLMCKTHNALLAERDYGKEVMARCRSESRASEPVAGSVERVPEARRQRPPPDNRAGLEAQ